MESIDRAFYHELGHYVAHSLNKKLYNRFGITEFEIYTCKEDETVWCGHVTPKKPDDFDENDTNKPPPIERLHFVLASIMYGCLFQAYYCNTNLKCCYDKFGFSDANKWLCFLTGHKLGDLNSDIAMMEELYLKEVVKKKQLDPFMSIIPADYLIRKEENRYTVNLEKLENDLSELIDDHANLYQKVVEQYEQVIKDHISPVK